MADTPLFVSGPDRAGHRLERAYRRVLLPMAALVAFYGLILYTGPDPFWTDAGNTYGPPALMIMLCLLSARVLRIEPDAVWTAALWFPVQSAIFFGFGALVAVFGSEWTRAALAAHPLALTPQELLRTNLLSALGILSVLAGFWLHLRLRSRAWQAASTAGQSAPAIAPGHLAVGFILFGAALKYGLIKPAEWGMAERIVPGALGGLVYVLDIGFALAAFGAAQGHRRSRLLFWGLWPLHLVLCTLSFAKIELVLAVLFPALAVFTATGNRRRFVLWFAVMATLYALSQPLVKFGRAEIQHVTGSISQAGYAERAEIVLRFAAQTHQPLQSLPETGGQGWWTRLSFSGAQASAMRLRDSGMPIDSLRDVWLRFIPRVLWPEKPVLTGPALEFYRVSTENWEGHSFLAVSIYGDLYMQFGWSGVVIGGAMVGWLFAMLSGRSLRAVRKREFLMLPAVLIALRMALQGPNNFVVTGIIGPLPIYAGYALIAALLVSALKWRRARSPAVPAPPDSISQLR